MDNIIEDTERVKGRDYIIEVKEREKESDNIIDDT